MNVDILSPISYLLSLFALAADLLYDSCASGNERISP